MLNCEWPTSTSARWASAEAGSFFFEPVQFHLEAANLLEELGLDGLVVFGSGLAAVAEEVLGAGQELLLPGMDQGGVNGVLAGQLVDRLVPLERRQGHLGLERCRMSLPLTCHRFPLSWTAVSSLVGCPVFGVHYTRNPRRPVSRRRGPDRAGRAHWSCRP